MFIQTKVSYVIGSEGKDSEDRALDIFEDLKDSLYIDENGNAVSVFSSSFRKSLSTKVKAKLDGVKKVKADNDGKNFYCKASLSMKKYWNTREYRSRYTFWKWRVH